MTFLWLIAPIQHVVIRHAGTGVTSLGSAVPFGEAGCWAGSRVGAVTALLVPPPWCSLCARGRAVGWVSSPSVPTPSHHLTNSAASGNWMEEACCLTEPAQRARFALSCLHLEVPTHLILISFTQGLSFSGMFAIGPTSLSLKLG